MKLPSVLTVGLAAALTCTPMLAQAAAPGAAGNSAQQPTQTANINKPEPGTATINPTGIPSSQRNPLLTDQGRVRIDKLIGSDIYNKNDKKVGTVKDVLADRNGQVEVVISANGKQVVAPWDKLQFGDAKLNSDNKVLMLNETQQSLASLPAYDPHTPNGSKKG